VYKRQDNTQVTASQLLEAGKTVALAKGLFGFPLAILAVNLTLVVNPDG